MSLPDLENYIDFILKVHKPKRIYIGLDFFQFGKYNFYSSRENFSVERLNTIAKYKDTPVIYCLKIADNMPFIYYVFDTLKYSLKNKDLDSCYQNGADIGRGESGNINTGEYYHFINGFIKQYSEWKYEPDSIKTLNRIMNKLNKEHVETVVFFNPISIDLLVAIDLTDKMNDFYNVKKEISKTTSFYDFCYASSITEMRHNFYDASHYNMKTGDIVFDNLNNNIDDDIVLKCNNNNIEDVLCKEINRFEDWRTNNIQYYKYLKNKVINKEKIEEKELYEFIGF